MTHALATKAEPWNSDDEQRRLLEIMERQYLRVFRAVHAVVARAFPTATNFRLDDPSTRRMLMQAAHRVVRIDEATRQAIAEMLQRGQELGLPTWNLAHGSPEHNFPGIDGLFKERWKSRADTVARTELQHAQVISAEDRYLATGMVDRVQIRDGDFDAACAARDGKIVPIQSSPRPLHPNCRMTILPILREGMV